MQEIC